MAAVAPAMGNVHGFHRTAFFLLLAAFGCGGASPRPAPAAEAAPEPPRAGELEGVPWTSVSLESIPALISLPDARGWRASRSGTFVVLEHRATGSSLTLRVWRAARLVRPSECEAEARLARPGLPVAAEPNRIDERKIGAPSGFDVRLVVAAQPGPGSRVHGSALAVGAGVGRCYLASFETSAEGPRGAERVAERLAVVVPGTLETVQLEGAERRVPPPPGVK